MCLMIRSFVKDTENFSTRNDFHHKKILKSRNYPFFFLISIEK